MSGTANIFRIPVAKVTEAEAVERIVETLDFSNAETAKFLSREPRRTSTEFGIGELQ